jgi:predicted ATPase/DNA-binding SARP family transcriptional activator/DNA-binding CsgD family transcriptional regulator
MTDRRSKAKTRSGPKRTSDRPEVVRIRLLGGFEVTVGAQTIEEGQWRLRKAASLVKLLALSQGHRLHREQVMDLLWPDLGIRAASNNLRGALHVARRTLEPNTGSPESYLSFQGEQLALCPAGRLWVDVDAFEEAAEEARHVRNPAAYRAAIELYVGELLPEDRYEDWAEERRAELRETYLKLLVGLAGLHEERGEYERAIEALRKAVAEEPTRVEAHAGLMRLYALSERRAAALEQYERLKSILSEWLGAEPDAETRRLREEIASGWFPPPTQTTQEEPPLEEHPGAHNLPVQRTSFVGREREIVELKRLLSMTGLLTLTGAGGSGKTRLALEVAGELASLYPDGVWLVELAPLSDPDLVAQQVAKALSVREQPDLAHMEMLVEHLRQKNALLVLDNCEHLVDATSDLAGVLLGSSPRLKILATSREPLGVAGEVNWRVSPLSVPSTDHLPDAENLARYESVRLFVDRARLRLPAFELTQENAGAVARVCRKLDGIPLAIELATARMGALAVEQVAERLEVSLDVLKGGSRTAEPRQQTLRATLDWSYELLSEPERKLFGQLSVFAGGFTLEAAEAVGTGDGIEESEVLESFFMLVDKSLVVAEMGAEDAHRYRMLEPVRQYAREKLEESGEAERVRERHARHYLALAEVAEPELVGARQVAWLERLETEYGNFQTALSWSLEREVNVELGARLAGALWRFWYKRGYLSAGRQWLEAALSGSGALPEIVHAKLLTGSGMLAWEQGDYASAMVLHEESLSLRRQMRDRPGVASSLNNVGLVALYIGDYERATELHEESLALRRELGDARGSAASLHNLGLVALYEGNRARSKAFMEESLSIYRELKDEWTISILLNNLGLVELYEGEHQRAVELQKESLTLRRELGDRGGVAECLEGLSGVAASKGEAARAARLWAAAESLREAIGAPPPPSHRSLYDAYLVPARSRLEDEAWGAAWSEGRAMQQEEAIEYALGTEPTTPAAPKRPTLGESPDPLTPREQEIAALIARGLTNRQIAAELSISEHTVANHVAKILRKLGLRSRSQLPPS